MNVLITAGATREPIDDVRFLSNVSTGQTGAALADAFTAAGHAVTLLSGEGSATPGIVHRKEVFSSTSDLAVKLQRELSVGSYGLVIMAAAVSDYRPEAPVAGKLSSCESELTLRLVRNEKILPRLKSLSPAPLSVVGFKLTSGADEASRRAAVGAQFAAGGVDLVVHNDLSEIRAVKREEHPFWLYSSPEKNPQRIQGATALALTLVVRGRFDVPVSA